MMANINILQKLMPIMNNKQIAHQRFCSQNCELIPHVQKWVKGENRGKIRAPEGNRGPSPHMESHPLCLA